MDFIIERVTNLSPDTVDITIQKIKEVWAKMPTPEWFAMDSDEEISDYFTSGKSWLYVAKEISEDSKDSANPECSGDLTDCMDSVKAVFHNDARDFDCPEFAGLFTTIFPGLGEENLGRDLGFSDEDLMKSAHMETVIIAPEYRGHHLQARLMAKAEEDLKSAGYKHLLCTIHPENPYSLNNALSLGYKVEKLVEKYGGLPRNILLKEI